MQIFRPAELEKINILLVEPDGEEQGKIKHLLLSQGFHLVCVECAENALPVLEQSRVNGLPDLIVVCTWLAGMSAGQLVRRLRLDGWLRSIPVLMLTEDVSSGVERDGLESGADAYISRSAHPDLLFLRIRALLQTGTERIPEEDSAKLRRARIVIVNPPTDESLLNFWENAQAEFLEDDLDDDYQEGPGLGELLWRDGYTVTTVERSTDLIEGGWLGSGSAPDCLVLVDLGKGEGDLEFCQLIEKRRQAIKEAGATPFRILGIVEAQRFRGQSSVAYLEAGIDDLVSSDISLDVLALRIRTLAQRRMAEESFRQKESERQRAAIALEAARAKAEMAEALEQANQELAHTNTQLIQAQAKLVHTAKMASLGELVAGIAHEINNPLAFTISHASTVAASLAALKTEVTSEDTRKKIEKGSSRLEAMKIGLQRIQNLVVGLRRFSRLDETVFQKVDVVEALEITLTLLAHKLGKNIQVTKKLEAPSHLICQASLINQAVMNIISNAADAIASGYKASEPAQGHIEIATHLQNDSYIITVCDDGTGLKEDVQHRVFDPFFTTKPVGEGTGLGLAIAHGVVEAHGGTIEIGPGLWEHKPASGTCFRLVIPVYQTPEGLAAKGRVK
ncbi:hybrid sensor histidine kinase/response regulator [Aristophania vespae]|uniref:histidine kinase n=1 Tax=Aristophania vespae TaxID=2697033 RepID=A0A6P1NFY0_9PROT|nr:ATP-binding protein [Aristophania vespae]QHI95817.1 hybrid sensor histidine kinase/response regulator [Aristophania vespae]UMM63529.1 Adaptive-response sensory-kinase SasA [Aristophania vespae]